MRPATMAMALLVATRSLTLDFYRNKKRGSPVGIATVQ